MMQSLNKSLSALALQSQVNIISNVHVLLLCVNFINLQLMYLQVQSATLSIEVSYPFHSHLIGRSGQNINRVMEETETRIHFPDRNRIAGESKSNSVIIRGPLANLENARQRIRVSLSLSVNISPVLMSLCDFRQISQSSLSSIAALKGLIQSASYI